MGGGWTALWGACGNGAGTAIHAFPRRNEWPQWVQLIIPRGSERAALDTVGVDCVEEGSWLGACPCDCVEIDNKAPSHLG